MKIKASLLAAILCSPVLVLANVCQDLQTKIDYLYSGTVRAMSNTTDPEMQAALLFTYQEKLAKIMELVPPECSLVVPSLPQISVPPQLPPPPPPPVVEPPVVEPPAEELPPADDPGDVEEPGTTPADQGCLEQLDAYSDQLRAQGLRQDEFVHRMQAKVRELNCRNYGHWRSHYARKCQKKAASDHKKKCEVKKQASCNHR